MAGVLEHILFAKDWLNKAERKIRNGHVIEGEMLLSLAESETHKAWEESISTRKKPCSSKKILKIITAVVLFIVVTAGSLYYFGDKNLTSSSISMENRELELTEGYRQIVEQSQSQVKLINIDLSIN